MWLHDDGFVGSLHKKIAQSGSTSYWGSRICGVLVMESGAPFVSSGAIGSLWVLVAWFSSCDEMDWSDTDVVFLKQKYINNKLLLAIV
jgi:hypothetical protein